MASMTVSPSLPAQTHSPNISPFDISTTTPFDHESPLPTPTGQLSPAFVFPERKSFETSSLESTASMPIAMPSAGGSHGRRSSRQGRPTLPDFTFNPGATMAESTSPLPSPSPKTHPVLEQMAANTRQFHAPKPSALPAFTFNPGATIEPRRTPSPTKSTFSDAGARPVSQQNNGEVVDADGESPELSTTPTKVEMQQPRSGPPPSSGPPRGHRHRRSGALSVAEVDLSSIIKANAMAKHRPGSVPSTPGTPSEAAGSEFFDAASMHEPASPSVGSPPMISPPTSPHRRGSTPGSGPRPRVAFSDTVAEIPRPLSMISSETEGSTSTIRAGHSVSNSINSFTSPSRSTSSLSISRENDSPPRPKSAGNLGAQPSHDEIASPARNPSPTRPFSAFIPPSVLSPGSPFSKKMHFWSTPTTDENDEQENAADQEKDSVEDEAIPDLAQVQTSDNARPRTSPERKASLKKRKVRTWTGGIFSRKGKQRAAVRKGRRTPTPPLSRQLSDNVFDNDATVVIEDASKMQALRETQPRLIQPSATSDSDDSDTVSPVIDLDAALGPFGSDERFTKTAASRRRLHSSRTGIPFDDAYHRRAESAPHLPPVNRTSFGIGRMGSSSSLSEDVFDEEEEDHYLAGEKGTSGSKVQRKGSGSSAAKQETNLHVPAAASSTDVSSRTSDPLSLTDAVDEVQILDEDGSHTADRSSGSTIQPPLMTGVENKQPVSVPLDLAYPMTQESYASSGEGPSVPGSAISSPELDHAAFDHQPPRSGQLNPPSREQSLRASTDDIPSLTDSVSTATGHVPRISSSANTRSSADQRSASFSGVASWSAARASKRASLVSLTRLIPGSSHGERSKLRFGETVEDEMPEKQRRKSHRLSRLMTFWRSKDKD